MLMCRACLCVAGGLVVPGRMTEGAVCTGGDKKGDFVLMGIGRD